MASNAVPRPISPGWVAPPPSGRRGVGRGRSKGTHRFPPGSVVARFPLLSRGLEARPAGPYNYSHGGRTNETAGGTTDHVFTAARVTYPVANAYSSWWAHVCRPILVPTVTSRSQHA